MSKRKKEDHPALKRFVYDKETNKTTCLIGGCKEANVTFSGNHAGNLKAHLERFHKDEYEAVVAEQEAQGLLRESERSQHQQKKDTQNRRQYLC